VSGDRHPAPETLAEAEGRPLDDPTRRHLEDCPRCQARLLAYRRFVVEPADLPAEDRAAARVRLQAALRAEMEQSHVAGRAPTARARRSWLATWWRGLPLRPAYAVAAALVGVLAISLGPVLWRQAPETLRQAELTGSVELLAPVAEGDSLALRWRASPGADAYRVTFYTVDLQPIEPPAVRQDTVLRVPVASLRRGGGAWTYVRVTALREGDAIADSGPRSVPTP
jgi:hypothetical protein